MGCAKHGAEHFVNHLFAAAELAIMHAVTARLTERMLAAEKTVHEREGIVATHAHHGYAASARWSGYCCYRMHLIFP